MNEDPLKETMDYIKNTKEGMMEYTSDYARWKREGEEGALTASQIAEYLDIPLSEVYRIAENISY